ncbi:MAG: peptidoglycan-binding protein [Bryobacterales bacterium]|nr:peptidoglycan-binding protein [Bryobacterales bacterium]
MGLIAKAADGTCRASFKAAAPGSASAKAYLDLNINHSVGKRGVNNARDVLAVQQALNRIGPELAGPATILKEDGIVGPKTQRAIDDFQRRHFGSGKADGTIDVNNRTQAKISSLQPPKLARMSSMVTFLDTARRCIRAAEAKVILAMAEANGAPATTSALAMVDKHFAVSKSSNRNLAMSFILSVFRDMGGIFARTGMSGATGWSMYFEAEPFTNTDLFAFTWFNGYMEMGVYGNVSDTGGIDQPWFRHDTVYLSAVLDKCSDDDRVQTIVHELAHFVGPSSGNSERVTDNAYGDADNPKMIALDTAKRIHNAECYGNFAFDTVFGRSPAHAKHS